MEDWLQLTTEENAIDYLERAAEFVQRPDPTKWKWVPIALHGALYAFAICALRGTDPDRVIANTTTGKAKLIGFKEALKRRQLAEYMHQYEHSRILVLSPEEIEAIRKINETFRNNFMHFTPKSWFIETSGMPLIVKRCCRPMRFLALESGNIRLHGYGEPNRICRALKILTT